MRKFTTSILVLLLLTMLTNAQTVEKKWGFGAGAGGYVNIASDGIGFTPEFYLSRYLSPSIDIMLNADIGLWGNGVALEPMDFFHPSLKVRYKFFNGYIMPVENKWQPYVTGGIGYLLDNAVEGVNFNFAGGVKYPLNKTLSLFAEAGYIHGIDSKRTLLDNTIENAHDNFVKAIVGIEVSFIRQPDTDKDGVIDPMDQCPDTPKGAVVDEHGCPRDTDKDGVFDGIDQCPNTAFNVEVDEKGCALDADNDGVPDSEDKCPDTPQKVKVDENGCTLDTDKDGVPDSNDKCPETPSGVEVDEDGCTIDSDGDGVSDKIDKCPKTPKGNEVDENGCTLDADKDGVSDKNDECPDTKEGVVVDEKGCIDYEATIELMNDRLYPIYFATNQATVTNVQNNKIDNLVEILNKYPEYKVNLYGHADHRGTDEYNKALSQKRANDVVKLLKSKGISSDRITTKAYGEEMAEQGELTEEQLQENRKVASYIYMVITD